MFLPMAMQMDHVSVNQCSGFISTKPIILVNSVNTCRICHICHSLTLEQSRGSEERCRTSQHLRVADWKVANLPVVCFGVNPRGFREN